MGYERFVQEADAQELDHDVEGKQTRYLLRIEPSNDEPFVGLVVIIPSTKRHYALRVPPDMQSCQQAVAWVGKPDNPKDYVPQGEEG